MFSFLRVHKKHKNANKRISYFFPLGCFLSAFLFLFAYLRFVLLLGCVFVLFCVFLLFVLFGAFVAFCCFLMLFGVCEIFLLKKKKNNKEFKTALITSFILLLTLRKHQVSVHQNLHFLIRWRPFYCLCPKICFTGKLF